MLKEENYKLIKKDLDIFNQNYYTEYDLADMIEMSYILGKTKEMEQFNEILEICNDGIISYSVFVKFLYDKYCKESNGKSLEDYINKNVNIVFKEFKEKYYI